MYNYASACGKKAFQFDVFALLLVSWSKEVTVAVKNSIHSLATWDDSACMKNVLNLFSESKIPKLPRRREIRAQYQNSH
jgi:hypothetical protein